VATTLLLTVYVGHIAALTEMASIGHQVSVGCSKYAVPALCYAAFPLCAGEQASDGQAASRRPLGICRDDCQRLTNVACEAEYEFARRTTIRVGTTNTPCPIAITDINVARVSDAGRRI